MNIPIEEIINFHIKRTNCHVQTLNYFAQILGYHFPEHDSDKYKEPYIFGYAYCNYAKHHKNCAMLPQQKEIFAKVHEEHHKMQPHHIEHYTSMQDISNIALTEMLCDWHSANFEQNFITNENEFSSISDFFQKKMSKLDWSKKQLEYINMVIEKISTTSNYEEIKQIWEGLPRN